MSTNAAIGMTMPDGTIKAVYLHWDGYITDGGAGETLAEHYKNRTKVEKLIALGFLSSLGAEVDPNPATPHSWSNPQPGVTVAYHRDRKEPLQPAVEFKDKDSFAEEAKGSLWASIYLFIHSFNSPALSMKLGTGGGELINPQKEHQVPSKKVQT